MKSIFIAVSYCIILFSCSQQKNKVQHTSSYNLDSSNSIRLLVQLDSIARSYSDFKVFNHKNVPRFYPFPIKNNYTVNSLITLPPKLIVCNFNMPLENKRQLATEYESKEQVNNDYQKIISDSTFFQVSLFLSGIKDEQDISCSIFRLGINSGLADSISSSLLKKYWYTCNEWNTHKEFFEKKNFIVVFRYGKLDNAENLIVRKIIKKFIALFQSL